MASDFRFVPDTAGFIALRNSDGVKRTCLSQAQQIATKAASMNTSLGATFSADVREGLTRCHAIAKQDGGTAHGGPLQRARGF